MIALAPVARRIVSPEGRIMRSFVLLMLLASAATAADQCRRDSDCGTGKTCIANRCTAPREDEAAVGAVVANRDMNFVPALTMSINNVPTFSATSGPGSTIALAISPGFLFGYRVNQAFQLFATGGFIFPLTARDDTPDLLGLHVEPRFQ